VPTVLLVDDSPGQMATRQAVLHHAGFTVFIATNAQSALGLLRSPSGESVDAIVTDHLMPQINGAEFVRLLRDYGNHIPVVVVSGLPDADAEYDGLDNVYFRLKPCSPPELIKLVQELTKAAS
jgi:CheY-like chemotaxis protein